MSLVPKLRHPFPDWSVILDHHELSLHMTRTRNLVFVHPPSLGTYTDGLPSPKTTNLMTKIRRRSPRKHNILEGSDISFRGLLYSVNLFRVSKYSTITFSFRHILVEMILFSSNATDTRDFTVRTIDRLFVLVEV